MICNWPECKELSFSGPGFLKEHVSRVHNGKMPYFCEFCGKKIGDDFVKDSSRPTMKKYCSQKCQQTFHRRKASARLGIPGREFHGASPLSKLYD